MEHVKGKKKADIILFALSTCIWCRKTKSLLDELGVDYNYVYVDLAEGEERDLIKKEMQRWNPKMSFPTIVLNSSKCIVGFDEQGIRNGLK